MIIIKLKKSQALKAILKIIDEFHMKRRLQKVEQYIVIVVH